MTQYVWDNLGEYILLCPAEHSQTSFLAGQCAYLTRLGRYCAMVFAWVSSTSSRRPGAGRKPTTRRYMTVGVNALHCSYQLLGGEGNFKWYVERLK